MKIGDLVCISKKAVMHHLDNTLGVVVSTRPANNAAYNTSEHARSIAGLREPKWKVYFSNNSLVELYSWELENVEEDQLSTR